jgi:propanediol utilization protein
MSEQIDQLASALADAVIEQMRGAGRLPTAGGSWVAGSWVGGKEGGAALVVASAAGTAAGRVPDGLDTDPLWHPAAPRTFSRERVAQGEVPVGVSARHCHVTQEALVALFGPGASLTFDFPLMQKGEFAARERVTVRAQGGDREIKGVRILGPTRNLVQVEVAQTDLRVLRIDAPVRPSGTHDGSPGALLIGPAGTWTMPSGVIRANRHVHLSPANATALGLAENDVVEVRLEGPKPLTYHDVQVRVRDTFAAQFHLDTDDANAADVSDGFVARIVRKVGRLGD